MKKIVATLFFILFSSSVFANNTESVTLEQKDLTKDETEVIFEEPIALDSEKTLEYEIEKEINPYTKEALKGIIEKEYDLNSTEGMFHKQLTTNFHKGFVKSAGLQGNFIFNFTESIEKNDSDLKFKTQLINVGLSGEFKNKKDRYNMLFDLTPDIKDSFFHRLVLDAWVETKRIPHHTLIFGTSRPNVGYEGGQSPYLIPLLNRSQTARNFGNMRKTGVRIKGDYKYVDYDLGGYSSDTWYSEFFPGVETDLWVNFKPFANVKEKIGNLNIGGGIATGSRNSHDFLVGSAAVRYNYKNFWLRMEYQNADGSNGNDGLTDKKRWGYNFTIAYRITKKLELLFRYDDFDPDKSIAKNNTREYTAGINYFILGQTARLMLNYVFCQNSALNNSHRILVGTQFLL